jgi:hypothetical protein
MKSRERLRRRSEPTRGENPAAIVQELGGKFSHELGIELAAGRSAEIFKWFLASVLFGARISETRLAGGEQSI